MLPAFRTNGRPATPKCWPHIWLSAASSSPAKRRRRVVACPSSGPRRTVVGISTPRSPASEKLSATNKTRLTSPLNLPLNPWPSLSSRHLSLALTGPVNCSQCTVAWNPAISQSAPISLDLVLSSSCVHPAPRLNHCQAAYPVVHHRRRGPESQIDANLSGCNVKFQVATTTLAPDVGS